MLKMTTYYYIQTVISSLAFGSVYALITLGVTVLWNSMNIMNFAHGSFLMLGAYLAIVFFHYTLQWSAALGLLLSLVFLSLVGMLLSQTIYERLSKRPLLTTVIATMGLSMVVENSVLVGFGPRPRAFQGLFGRAMVFIGSYRILVNHLFAFALACILIALLAIVAKYTKTGKVIRAIAFDKETSGLMGIPVLPYLAVSFGLALALAGLAGFLLAPVTYISVDMGAVLGAKAFAAMVVGGFGSFTGAIVGSYIIGLAEGLGSIFLGTVYRDVVTFALVLFVLLLRPRGLFGGIQAERV